MSKTTTSPSIVAILAMVALGACGTDPYTGDSTPEPDGGGAEAGSLVVTDAIYLYRYIN